MLLYSVWECTTLLSFAFGSQSFIFTLPSNLSVCMTRAWHSMRQHGWVKGTCRSGLECQFKRGTANERGSYFPHLHVPNQSPTLQSFPTFMKRIILHQRQGSTRQQHFLALCLRVHRSALIFAPGFSSLLHSELLQSDILLATCIYHTLNTCRELCET